MANRKTQKKREREAAKKKLGGVQNGRYNPPTSNDSIGGRSAPI